MSLREVGPGIVIATSRRDSLNSVVVAAGESEPEALLIDPGWEPDELDALAQSLAERRLEPVAGLATHAHHDHLLWHPRFGAWGRVDPGLPCLDRRRHAPGMLAIHEVQAAAVTR